MRRIEYPPLTTCISILVEWGWGVVLEEGKKTGEKDRIPTANNMHLNLSGVGGGVVLEEVKKTSEKDRIPTANNMHLNLSGVGGGC